MLSQSRYNGEPGGQPLRAGVAVADVFAGALITQAILAALYQREKTDVGRRVDVNLLEGIISLGTSQVSRYLTSGQVPQAQGNDHPSIVPYGTFECADGMFNLAVGNDSLWRRFCDALGFRTLRNNAQYDTNEGRVHHREALNAEMFPPLKQFTRAEITARLDAAGVPCGPVYNMQEVFNDPHVQERGVAVQVPHTTLGETTVTAAPWRIDGQTPPVRRAPPTPGQHTAEVLAELGLAELGLTELGLAEGEK